MHARTHQETNSGDFLITETEHRQTGHKLKQQKQKQKSGPELTGKYRLKCRRE